MLLPVCYGNGFIIMRLIFYNSTLQGLNNLACYNGNIRSEVNFTIIISGKIIYINTSMFKN